MSAKARAKITKQHSHSLSHKQWIFLKTVKPMICARNRTHIHIHIHSQTVLNIAVSHTITQNITFTLLCFRFCSATVTLNGRVHSFTLCVYSIHVNIKHYIYTHTHTLKYMHTTMKCLIVKEHWCIRMRSV